MKEPNDQKRELLLKLSEIYDQLEELDTVLHTSIKEYKRDIQEEHLKRLSVCEEKLFAMETEVDMFEIMEQKSPAVKASGGILELGY
ncbi:hypothetical protein C0966_08350 [Bacillus methanolicus]|uniref:hypothetical protein n=1 Tax=Bacillus methanolicus TaxID=1471 RepID=UPI002380C2FD|nr:hypothetical protein [Bacillus methanolicus]MDE3839362.1 hypothetical protein [Bacillus methanolicus]